MSLLHNMNYYIVGRDSSVVIATRYGLDDPGIESLWEARFFAPVQTGPGAQPPSHPIEYRVILNGKAVITLPHPGRC